MMQVRLVKNKSNHSPLKETFEPHLLGELQPPCQQQKDVLGSSSKETECSFEYSLVSSISIQDSSAKSYSFSEVRAKKKRKDVDKFECKVNQAVVKWESHCEIEFTNLESHLELQQGQLRWMK